MSYSTLKVSGFKTEKITEENHNVESYVRNLLKDKQIYEFNSYDYSNDDFEYISNVVVVVHGYPDSFGYERDIYIAYHHSSDPSLLDVISDAKRLLDKEGEYY